jgi:TRAP-type C4-dicarboxylate transport system substrate-binding protein
MSNGRIKFELYDAGALASVTGMLEAVDQGVLDISQSWGGYYTGDVPEGDVEIGLPLAWEEPWEAYDAYYNRGLGEVIAEAYESRFNVEHFPLLIDLRYGVSTRDPIASLDDLKGKKIRAIGVYGDLMQELGASAVVIPGAELYTALQLGTVDGIIYGAEAIAATGLEEFLKTMTYEPNWNTGVGHWIINRDTWSSLPPDLQQVIEFAAQYGSLAGTMNYAAKEAEKVAVLENAGVELLELSAEDRAKLNAAAMKIWDQIAARSELSKKAVEIVRKQQQEYGHIE